MHLAQLSARAMEIRQQFGRVAAAEGRREWSREEVMQGFVGDVGDLMKLVMAKADLRSIPDADAKLRHELADCLWSVLVLAELYGLDLEREFHATMDGIEARLQAR